MENTKRKNKKKKLSDLFDDCLVEIFCFLPLKSLLLNIPLVSKRFYNVLNTQIPESRWEIIYLKNFGFETNPSPPDDFKNFKNICFEKYKEFKLSKTYNQSDRLKSRIRTVSKEVEEKVIEHEAYSEDYLAEKDTLRKSTISLRIYTPTQIWEEITVEDLCRIRGSLEEPELFEGTLKVIGKDGLIFQMEFEEGQVFLKEQSCSNLVNHFHGREQVNNNIIDVEEEEDDDDDEEDEDGKGKFGWMEDFFMLIKKAIVFKHLKPLIKEFKLSPLDAIFVGEDEEIEELFPLLEEDPIDFNEIAELATAHPTNIGIQRGNGEEEEEEEIDEEDQAFIDDGNDGEEEDDDNDFFNDGVNAEGGGGVIVLDDDDDDDDDDEQDDAVIIVQSSKNVVMDLDDDEDNNDVDTGEVIILDDNDEVEEDYEQKEEEEEEEDDDDDDVTIIE